MAGCDQLAVDSFLKQARCGEVIIQEGDYLSVDGTTGNLYQGRYHWLPRKILVCCRRF